MKWTGMGAGVLAVAAAVGAAGVRAADEPVAKREKRTVVRMMRAGGGYLGVSLGDIAADDVKRLGLADERGALVSDVVEDSPAARAGLKAGDVIVGFEGETVRSAAHLSRLVRETPAGRSVDLAYLRAGARQEARVALGEPRPRAFPGMEDFKIEGLDKLRDSLEGLDLPEPP
jgi:serine protease Do